MNAAQAFQLGGTMSYLKHFQPKWTPVWRPEMRQNKGLELFWRFCHRLNCLSYEFSGSSARIEPLPVSAKMRAAAVVGSSLAWS